MTAKKTTQRIVYNARPHQMSVLKSDKQIIFLGAGVAAGKTDCGALFVGQKVRETPDGVLGLIAANTYTQLYDATLKNLYKNLQRFGFNYEPKSLPNSYQPLKIRIWNGKEWVEILCRSLDHYEALAGVEIGWFWMDEVYQTKREAFDVVNARMRDTRMFNQGLLTTTLDEPTSWMYEVFVEKCDPERMDVFYATTYDNAPNLPPDFIERMKQTYSPRYFERMVLAKWVSLESGQIYYNFDRKVHANHEAEFVPGIPVCWSLDFNIGTNKPMSSALGQVKRVYREGYGWRQEMHWFDEIILDSSDTNDAAEEARARLSERYVRPNEVRVYGDATGKRNDTRSRKTDYSILRDHGFGYQYVPKVNPPVRDRHNAMNAMLRTQDGSVRMLVHPRCGTILKGLEIGRLKKGAIYAEEETREQHVITAIGYLVSKEFPVIKPIPARISEVRMGGN